LVQLIFGEQISHVSISTDNAQNLYHFFGDPVNDGFDSLRVTLLLSIDGAFVAGFSLQFHRRAVHLDRL
jgi:hypothetical protein